MDSSALALLWACTVSYFWLRCIFAWWYNLYMYFHMVLHLIYVEVYVSKVLSFTHSLDKQQLIWLVHCSWCRILLKLPGNSCDILAILVLHQKKWFLSTKIPYGNFQWEKIKILMKKRTTKSYSWWRKYHFSDQLSWKIRFFTIGSKENRLWKIKFFWNFWGVNQENMYSWWRKELPIEKFDDNKSTINEVFDAKNNFAFIKIKLGSSF